MTDDIIATLRQHYAIAGTEPTHPVRRAIAEIERLRAALAAAPQPEPVAWYLPQEGTYDSLFRDHRTVVACTGNPWTDWIPLYTHPPAPDALREAARMALEALEALQGGCTDSDDGTVESLTVWCPEVIDALRAALREDK